MRETFEYTDTYDVNSSVIYGIYFNTNTNEVALDIKDMMYIYNNVPKNAIEDLADSDSPGKAYHKFAEQYGPGKAVGEYDENQLVKIDESKIVPVVPSVGTTVITGSSGSGMISTTGNLNSTTINFVQPRNFEVSFKIGDSTEIYKQTFNVVSYTEAIRQAKELGLMLGVKIRVQGVYISINE